MVYTINRGAQRSFTLYLDLLEGEYISATHDVILVVKHDVYDSNEEALILKRLRGEGAELTLEQASGPDPDPESTSTNVAVVSGSFTQDDTDALFTGVRARAETLELMLEAGVLFPDGYYETQLSDTFIVENTVYHVTPSV